MRTPAEVHRLGINFTKSPEAETGSAGEQPDQGIAGAELIADDEKSVVLPLRSFSWDAGPTGGRR
jgi:hypothetical protein